MKVLPFVLLIIILDVASGLDAFRHLPVFVKQLIGSSDEEAPIEQGNEDIETNSFKYQVNRIKNMLKGTISKTREDISLKLSQISSGLDTTFNETKEIFMDKVKLIFPGTKWCGGGDKASDYDDLGTQKEVDICCRDHDNCPSNIGAGKTEKGLTNKGLFTRSHCSCDTKFYHCLKDLDSVVSNTIGITYFTILGPQCFERQYPIEKCEQYKETRCVKYQFDENGEKTYQWFDNPTY